MSFDKDISSAINGLLNSSLFYWWFTIWGDGRDLLAQHIKSFPIDPNNIPLDLKTKLKPLVDELMRSYDAEKNSNTKMNVRKGGYAIKIKEIIPSKSKSIIDEIDDVLANYYEFSDSEKSFIKNFDIKFRINGIKAQEQNELGQNPRGIPLMSSSSIMTSMEANLQ